MVGILMNVKLVIYSKNLKGFVYFFSFARLKFGFLFTR